MCDAFCNLKKEEDQDFVRRIRQNISDSNHSEKASVDQIANTSNDALCCHDVNLNNNR